jgi:hypothetical protein
MQFANADARKLRHPFGPKKCQALHAPWKELSSHCAPTQNGKLMNEIKIIS